MAETHTYAEYQLPRTLWGLVTFWARRRLLGRIAGAYWRRFPPREDPAMVGRAVRATAAAGFMPAGLVGVVAGSEPDGGRRLYRMVFAGHEVLGPLPSAEFELVDE